MIYLYIQDQSPRIRIKTEEMTFINSLKSLTMNKTDVLFCFLETCGESLCFVNHLRTPQGDYYPDMLFRHPFTEKMLETDAWEDVDTLKKMPSHQLIIMAGDRDSLDEQLGEIVSHLTKVHAFLQEQYGETETSSLDDLANLRLTVTMRRNLNQALKYYRANGKDADLILNDFRNLAPQTKEEVRRIYHELYERLVS
jgi:hypothetical protein